MNASETSRGVINLAEYRAVRVATRQRSTPARPYLLWYPGVGYLHQHAAVAESSGTRGGFASEDRFRP